MNCSDQAILIYSINFTAVTQQVRFSSKDLKVKGEEDIEGNRARALERATSFKSQSQYPSFIIVARPSYINASSQLVSFC